MGTLFLYPDPGNCRGTEGNISMQGIGFVSTVVDSVYASVASSLLSQSSTCLARKSISITLIKICLTMLLPTQFMTLDTECSSQIKVGGLTAAKLTFQLAHSPEYAVEDALFAAGKQSRMFRRLY